MTLKKVALVLLSIIAYGIVIFLIYLWVNETPAKITTDPRTDLSANYQLWSANHIQNYQYNLEVDCLGCADADNMPFTIVVRDGETSSITDSSGKLLTITTNPNAAVYDLDYDAPFTSIDKIFAYSQNIASQDEDIKGTYDPALGFPTWMCYLQCQQRDPQAVDGYVVIFVKNFKKLP